MELEDPLESYNGLALFPQTLGHRHPPSTTDLLAMHNFLKSRPMSPSDELIQQGRSILETASQPPEITEKPPQELVASPRMRRKGLDRKRERTSFALIPESNISRTSVNLEPEFDFDKWRNPEELVLAYQRHLNAKKEIEKQTGRVSGDFSQNDGSTMGPRPRRQGMPGRARTAKYQHLYPIVSSQESIVEDILSPSNHGLQKESVDQDVVLQEKEVAASQQGEPGNSAAEDMELDGSVLQAEDKIDNVLDELLALHSDDLDGEVALKLLEDRLQIKSLKIGKLNVPDIHGAQAIYLKPPGTNVSEPRDVHNLLKGRSENPMMQKGTDNIADMTTGGIDQNLVHSDTSADARTTGPNAMENLVKSIRQDAASTSQPGLDDTDESLSHLETDADFQTEGSTGLEDMERNMEQEAVDSSLPCSMTWMSTENQFEQSDYPMDGCFEIQDDAPQQIQETVSEMHNEKNKESSAVSKGGQVKAKSQSHKKGLSRRKQKNKERSVVSKEGQVRARPQSRNKELSRRQSLAAAGTTWTGGVRRSTRVRSRPLEFWRGEKFLYGRIHESLATVIGIKKFQTPKKGGKDGNRGLVVDSFVSGEYQDLIDLAAL